MIHALISRVLTKKKKNSKFSGWPESLVTLFQTVGACVELSWEKHETEKFIKFSFA